MVDKECEVSSETSSFDSVRISLVLLFKLTTLKCVEGKGEKNLNSVPEGLSWWLTFIMVGCRL